MLQGKRGHLRLSRQVPTESRKRGQLFPPLFGGCSAVLLQLDCASLLDWKRVSFVTASACPVWSVVAGPDEDGRPHAETLKANRTRGALPQWAYSVLDLTSAPRLLSMMGVEGGYTEIALRQGGPRGRQLSCASEWCSPDTHTTRLPIMLHSCRRAWQTTRLPPGGDEAESEGGRQGAQAARSANRAVWRDLATWRARGRGGEEALSPTSSRCWRTPSSPATACPRGRRRALQRGLRPAAIHAAAAGDRRRGRG